MRILTVSRAVFFVGILKNEFAIFHLHFCLLTLKINSFIHYNNNRILSLCSILLLRTARCVEQQNMSRLENVTAGIGAEIPRTGSGNRIGKKSEERNGRNFYVRKGSSP